MRIIGGTARGRKLAGFSGRGIRPTPDRVREAIFNILISRLGSLAGKTVLDLFAGTGAMALEALSRGARFALLVDQGDQAAGIIPGNLKACGFEGRGEFLRTDAFRVLPRLADRDPFDLIFLDPPYGRDLVPKVIQAVSDLGLLTHSGLLCAEAARKDPVPAAIGDLLAIDERTYGSTTVHIFSYPEEGTP